MYFVYILRSLKTGRYYIGFTDDLVRRLKEHNGGKTKSLVKHIPLEIIYQECYLSREEARRRELQIKSYKSGEAFKRILEGK